VVVPQLVDEECRDRSLRMVDGDREAAAVEAESGPRRRRLGHDRPARHDEGARDVGRRLSTLGDAPQDRCSGSCTERHALEASEHRTTYSLVPTSCDGDGEPADDNDGDARDDDERRAKPWPDGGDEHGPVGIGSAGVRHGRVRGLRVSRVPSGRVAASLLCSGRRRDLLDRLLD